MVTHEGIIFSYRIGLLFWYQTKNQQKKRYKEEKRKLLLLANNHLLCVGNNFTSDANWQHQSPSPAFLSQPDSSFGTDLSLGQISLNVSCPPLYWGENKSQKSRGVRNIYIGNNQGSIVRRWSRYQDKKDRDELWQQLRRHKRERARCAGSGSRQSKALGCQVSAFQSRFLLFWAPFAIGIPVLFSF